MPCSALGPNLAAFLGLEEFIIKRQQAAQSQVLRRNFTGSPDPSSEQVGRPQALPPLSTQVFKESHMGSRRMGRLIR